MHIHVEYMCMKKSTYYCLVMVYIYMYNVHEAKIHVRDSDYNNSKGMVFFCVQGIV